jgi:hypothetical protein
MRRDARGCRPPSSERGGGKTGSAAQNLPRFSSTATTVPEGLGEDPPLEPPEGLFAFREGLPGLPVGLPDIPTVFPDLPDDSPDFPGLAALPNLAGLPVGLFPLDLRGELT